MRLEAENLAGERGGETIFSALSFELSSGEALVVTGPNGSGKSTLLQIICGLLALEEGKISLSDEGTSLPVRAACHYLGHQNAMKPALSVRENLLFWQKFNGEPRLDIDEALEAVDLPGVEHLPFGYLSTGQKRRVSIAKLLVSHRRCGLSTSRLLVWIKHPRPVLPGLCATICKKVGWLLPPRIFHWG